MTLFSEGEGGEGGECEGYIYYMLGPVTPSQLWVPETS